MSPFGGMENARDIIRLTYHTGIMMKTETLYLSGIHTLKIINFDLEVMRGDEV